MLASELVPDGQPRGAYILHGLLHRDWERRNRRASQFERIDELVEPSSITRTSVQLRVTKKRKPWDEVVNTLQIPEGARNLGLTYCIVANVNHKEFANAGVADKKKDTRFVPGDVVMLAGAVRSWSSKTQALVTLSSVEA